MAKIPAKQAITASIKDNCTPKLVGVAGFEPATSPSRTVRATGLRHTPNLFHFSIFTLRPGCKLI